MVYTLKIKMTKLCNKTFINKRSTEDRLAKIRTKTKQTIIHKYKINIDGPFWKPWQGQLSGMSM